MSTVTVKTFETPNTIVKMENIFIDREKHSFTMDLKIGHVSQPMTIGGSITSELWHWLYELKPEKVKVVADNEQGWEWIKTGKMYTTFQRYLKKAGFGSLEDSEDVLSQLIFECDNNSPSYKDNPFRLFLGETRATLTLVNIPSKKTISVKDEVTGQVHTRFVNKIGTMPDGSKIKAFIRPEKYRRLVVQKTVQRELYVEPTQSQEP